MGTSTSSAGAPGGSPFDPPWLTDVEQGIDTSQSDAPLAPVPPAPQPDGGADDTETGADADAVQTVGPNIAPPGRYGEARRALSSFVKGGGSADLRKGINRLVNKGMGGSKRAASRMQSTVTAAAALGGLLSAARAGGDPGIDAWVASVKQRGLSATDIALEVAERLLPNGGSIDEESAKHAMDQAIIKLYDTDPNADIFNLTDDQIADVMTYTIAYDVYNRVQLELGRVFEKLKYSAKVVHERLGQVLDYVTGVVADAMKGAREGKKPRSMREVSAKAMDDAMFVFGTAE
ncbi:Qat anti-phage system associated protein QatB [Cupriavidus metallidurans]|uniref:Uncharacterized protein n=1 Tax=Cupriavidus metallidurans (strain ATCC 43123 / DSM 2839 / NBRC 102507 / CH34) TaxID=266264 RepID=Q1LLD2_CUPMC|nr:Qat anti-phage system associated protein QatB [Cupriavidus metallidurans]ABF09044.1 conserved hypothetical protein [Cupriavidus metallidurans CH34]QGS30065.1 hypothetical protein FOB83_14850 [Cupriavidus metallidurans]